MKGFGKLDGPNTVHVDLTEGGTQMLESKNIMIATGSEVAPLPPVPVDNAQGKIVDSTGALELKEVRIGWLTLTLQCEVAQGRCHCHCPCPGSQLGTLL